MQKNNSRKTKNQIVFDINKGLLISMQTNKQTNNNNKETNQTNKTLILRHLKIGYNFSKVLNERVTPTLTNGKCGLHETHETENKLTYTAGDSKIWNLTRC